MIRKYRFSFFSKSNIMGSKALQSSHQDNFKEYLPVFVLNCNVVYVLWFFVLTEPFCTLQVFKMYMSVTYKI